MGNELIRVPALVRTPGNFSKEEEEQILDKINRLTLEPFDSLKDLYVFTGRCSNDSLDSYRTRMDPFTTLKNYAEDLRSGVSLMPSHDIKKAPYGRSYDGELEAAAGEDEEVNAVRGHWYIPKNLQVNGENTNDSIRSIKSGILTNLSVGFGGEEMYYRCSSCGRDLFDYDCSHFPGMEDERGVITSAWVVNGRLREVSTVYKGSTPGAYIDKARAYAGQGELARKELLHLERSYNVQLDDGKRSYFVSDGKQNNEHKEGEERMSKNQLLDSIREAIRENKIEKAVVYDILSENGDKFRQPDDIELRNELGRDNTSVSSIRQLKKEAQQGRRYLEDVIDDAVKARVRAQGDSFNAENYRNMLVNYGDIDSIKSETESYAKQAKERFSAGRQTQQEDLDKDKGAGNGEGGKDEEDDDNERFDPFEENGLFEGGNK